MQIQKLKENILEAIHMSKISIKEVQNIRMLRVCSFNSLFKRGIELTAFSW